MTTIYIYPGAPNTGVDFSAPNAAAYDALAGGGASNTVVFSGGYSYTPEGGKWWGRDQRYGMDKRITVEVDGSGPVVFSALVYVHSGMAVSWSGDVATITLLSHASALDLDDKSEVLFGASWSANAEEVEIGWRYYRADSLAKVGADGLTVSGQRNGYGIFWADKSGSDLRLHVWCPGGSATRPEEQWGGIAVAVLFSGAGGVGCTPRCSPFVFKPSATNDPSGSSVAGDIRILGTRVAVGTPIEGDADADSTMSDITWDGISAYGRGWILFESGYGGTTISNMTVRNFHFDDRIDPTLVQAKSANTGGFESIVIGHRVRDAVIRDGSVFVGLSHGALSCVPLEGSYDGTGAEESRTSGLVLSNLRCVARTNQGPGTYTRAFAIRAMYDAIMQGCSFSGFSIPSKLHGTNTRAILNHYSLSGQSDTVMGVGDGEACFMISPAASEVAASGVEAASLSVVMHCNTIDRRGDEDRGSDGAYSCVTIKANTGITIPAGAVDARANVLLGDAGTVGVRVKQHDGGATVNTDQTMVRNLCAGEAQASLAPEGVPGLGTTQTLAALFSTGTVSGNVTDTAANILARGDLPARPAMAIGVEG